MWFLGFRFLFLDVDCWLCWVKIGYLVLANLQIRPVDTLVLAGFFLVSYQVTSWRFV